MIRNPPLNHKNRRWRDSAVLAVPYLTMPTPASTNTVLDPAIISAGAGIVGAILGSVITTFKDGWLHHSKNAADRTHLAIVVGSQLDEYIRACYKVALDDGRSNDPWADYAQEERRPQVKAPIFKPLELEVEWKALPAKLLHDILYLPLAADHAQTSVEFAAMESQDDVPDHTEFFWVRREQWAYLGLKATEIAKRLRKLSGVPEESKIKSGWDVEIGLNEMIQKVAQARKVCEEKIAAYHARKAKEDAGGT